MIEQQITSVSYGCTRSDGSYESIRLDATAKLLEGQSPTVAFQSLQEYVEEQAANASRSQHQSHVKLVREQLKALEDKESNLLEKIEKKQNLLTLFESEWEKAKQAWNELESFAEKQGFKLGVQFPPAPQISRGETNDDLEPNDEPEFDSQSDSDEIPY